MLSLAATMDASRSTTAIPFSACMPMACASTRGLKK